LASVPGAALAEDDCRRLGRRCRRGSQCCSKNGVRRREEKVCGCPEGKSRCGERCVDLKADERHCGSCTNRYAEGSECVGGTCAAACLSIGGSCTAGGQCCSGICDSGTCASCVSVGGSCTADIQCCAAEPFQLRICDNGTCATCRWNGNPCSSDGECCSGDCPISTNTYATPCLPNCSSCTEDSQCCTNNCDGGIDERLTCG
jgi:hypothetical protein